MIRNRRIPLVSSLIALALLGPVVGLVTHNAVRRSDDGRAIERSGRAAARFAFEIESEISHCRRLVMATAALLSTFDATTNQEFRHFAAELLSREGAIETLEWVPMVAGGDRGQHEADGRRDYGPGYEIRQEAERGVLVRAATRTEYFPVRFIEPLERNEAAVGFDLGSDPVSRAALSRTAETGRSTMSPPVRLVREAGEAWSVLLVAPVFDEAHRSGGIRPLRGFAVGVLRIGQLVSGLIPKQGAGAPENMTLELVAGDGTNAGAVIYAGPGADNQWALGADVVRYPLDLDGQVWTLVAGPTAAHLARERGSHPVLLGSAAFLGYELLLAVAFFARRAMRERNLRQQAEIARSVIHSVSEGVVVADGTGRIVAVNEAAQRVLGTDRVNLPPADWSKAFGLYVPGTDRHVPTEDLPLPRAIRGEEVPQTEIFVRNAQAPGGLSTSVTGAPLKDAEGRLIGGVAVFRDITEQKRAQELTERLSSAVEQTADSVFITDRSGVIQYVNSAFETVTGYPRSEAVGRTPRLLKSGLQEPQYYTNLWEAITRGDPFKATVINRKKNGEHFYAEQTITPMRDRSTGEITHFVSVMRDMTEHLKLKERDIEMRLGALVQRRLFPQETPRIAGYDIAGAVAPASATCGDYFDFVPRADGRLVLCVADASGHGVGAALVMTATRAYLHSLASSVTRLDMLADELSRLLLGDLEEHRFVTMILAELDVARNVISWVNCGHPTGYVLDRSGGVRCELVSTGAPLGLFQDASCTTGPSITLEPGEALVLLTDGVLEAAGEPGDEFGRSGVLKVLGSVLDRPAREISERVIAAVQSFSEGKPQNDDLTIVVCKRQVGA